MKKLSAFILGLFLTVPAFADVLRTVQGGATDVSVDLKIIDLADGSPETGVLFNTAGIDLEYCRDKAACVDITEAALTTPALTDAHEEGGFIEKGHGNYRLDLPDLAVAAGVDFVTIQGTVTDMIVIGGIVELTTDVPQTGDSFARLGAPAGASVSADVAAIEAQTDDIGAAGAGLTALATQASVNDVPTVSEFNARTLVAADYFDPAADAVANVTTVATTTTNTDMRGTDSALLASSAPANFGDLDIEVTTGQVDVGFWNNVEITTPLQSTADIWDVACTSPTAGTVREQLCSDVDDILGDTNALETRLTAVRAAYLDVLAVQDTALANCEVNTANFAGSTTTLACILTDRDGGAITQASGDLEGLQLVVTSGAQIREQRFIIDTTWDAGDSELQITLSRALPGTLADAVTAVIR